MEAVPVALVRLDPRLALPLGTIKLVEQLTPDAIENLRQEAYQPGEVFSAALPTAVKAQLHEKLAGTNWEHICNSIPLNSDGISPVYEILTHPNRPTISDWQNLNDPTEYQFAESWHYRSVVLTCAVLSGLAFVGAVLTLYGFGYAGAAAPSGENATLLTCVREWASVALISIVTCQLSWYLNYPNPNAIRYSLLAGVLYPVSAVVVSIDHIWRTKEEDKNRGERLNPRCYGLPSIHCYWGRAL